VRLLNRIIIWSIVVGLALSVAGGALAWNNGYRAYAIRTGSMTPAFPTGALVVDAPPTVRSPMVGDVITFETQTGLVTHRVHAVEGGSYETKGDANRTADVGMVQRQDVVGVVAWGAAYLGYVVVFFQQPTGVLSLMLLALSVWCAWSAFFPARDAVGKHLAAQPGDERLHSSEDASPVVRLPGDRAAAIEDGIIRLPKELALAAAGAAVVRVPEQRCSGPGRLSG
jgi:signal peptidase I